MNQNQIQSPSKEDLIKEYNIRMSRENLAVFTKAMMSRFDPTWYHMKYAQSLQDFASGLISKLSISIPPQHGKSTLSSVMLPAWLLGLNPDLKIAIVCYNQTMASRFGRQVQRIMTEPAYLDIFPNTRLSDGTDGYSKNNEELEIVDHSGSLRLVGVSGGLTGQAVDVLIIDDPYKDAAEAWSPIQRENVQVWYNTVAETRLHNQSRQLMVYTRWHESDLIGELLKEEDHGWKQISFPAIKVGEPNESDPRDEGDALWPARHDIKRLEAIRARDAYSFQSLYQCDPQPKEGLLYGAGFKIYTTLPETGKRRAYIDTADMGKDYLCAISYLENKDGIFVLDVIYTRDAMEKTEPLTAQMLTSSNVANAKIESNNGGRGFARNVEKLCRDYRNYRTAIEWFTQTQNKISRIHTNSSTVMNLIHFPEGWSTRWPKFFADVTMFSSLGRNTHDDAPDTLTGMAEGFKGNQSKSNAKILSIFH